jgi:nicotinate phosphoribosyltransferase
MIKNGKIIYDQFEIHLSKQYYEDNLNHFNLTEKRLINPHYYKVDISKDLISLKDNLIKSLIKEISKLEKEEQ